MIINFFLSCMQYVYLEVIGFSHSPVNFFLLVWTKTINKKKNNAYSKTLNPLIHIHTSPPALTWSASLSQVLRCRTCCSLSLFKPKLLKIFVCKQLNAYSKMLNPLIHIHTISSSLTWSASLSQVLSCRTCCSLSFLISDISSHLALRSPSSARSCSTCPFWME